MTHLPQNKGLRYAVLAGMVLLGLAFIGAGASKLLGPEMAQANFVNWGYPAWFALVIGTVELMAGLAVLWFRTRPYAAAVLVGNMVGATITHLVHAEYAMIGVTVLLGALAGLIAWIYRPDFVDERLHLHAHSPGH